MFRVHVALVISELLNDCSVCMKILINIVLNEWINKGMNKGKRSSKCGDSKGIKCRNLFRITKHDFFDIRNNCFPSCYLKTSNTQTFVVDSHSPWSQERCSPAGSSCLGWYRMEWSEMSHRSVSYKPAYPGCDQSSCFGVLSLFWSCQRDHPRGRSGSLWCYYSLIFLLPPHFPHISSRTIEQTQNHGHCWTLLGQIQTMNHL